MKQIIECVPNISEGRDTEKMPLDMINDRPHQIRALDKWIKKLVGCPLKISNMIPPYPEII